MYSRIIDFVSFMEKREQLRINKERGKPWPWTDDEILQEYKFTNVKRFHDRTTQFLYHHMYVPNFNQPMDIMLFNCGLFRYFGTIDFAQAVGYHESFGVREKNFISQLAYTWHNQKKKVFTGAYVITNGGIKRPKYDVVLYEYLTPLWENRKKLVRVFEKTLLWQDLAEAMYKLPGFGGTGFMTKEVLQDALLHPWFEDATDRDTWTPVGPGAARGLERVFEQHIVKSQQLDYIHEILQEYRKWCSDSFPVLTAHDIQFQLCEFDKYERVRLGQGRPRSKYRRKDV